MNIRRAVECAVGGGLFLGPFVYALSLSEPAPAVVECEASEPEIRWVEREVIVAGECVEPEAEPEPAPEPEPEPDQSDPLPEFAAPLLLVEGTHLILDTEVDAGWGRGPLFEPATGAEFGAAKRANPDRIPASTWALAGRTYDVYGREGKLCTARVGELLVLAQYEGGTVEDLVDPEAVTDLDDGELPLPAKEIRQLLWDTQPRWLVGQLIVEGECEGGLWARDAALPSPVVLVPSERPTAAAEARLERFRQSKALARLEADYRRYYEGLDEGPRRWTASWEELVEGDSPSVRSWVDGEGRDRVLTLDFGYPASCGSFDTELDIIEEWVDGELVPLDQDNSPWAIFDADLDGRLEYLYGEIDTQDRSRYVLSRSPELERSMTIGHDFMCPC